MNESDSNRPERDVQIKGRPRPGTNVGGNPINQSLIAPPPTTTRRNSTATSPLDSTDGDHPDLISFSSPPQTNEIMELYK